MNGLICDFNCRSGSIHFGHRGQFGINATLIKVPSGLVRDQPGKVYFGDHVGQFVLGDLKLGNFSAKLLALFHIGQSAIISALGCAQRLSRHQNATFVKKFKHLVKPFTLFTDEIVKRHAHILEIDLGGGHHVDAHLIANIGGCNTFTLGFHQDQADASIGGLTLRIRLAHHRIKPCHSPVGNKGFSAVDDPFISVTHCGGVQGSYV